MPESSLLVQVTLLLGAGIAAQWIASWLRLPALLLLLATGILLGPVTGVIVPQELFGDALRPLVSLAVAVVLFEGGLSLQFEEARRAGPTLWRLIVSGLVLGTALTTAVGVWIAGLSFGTALVFGSVMVVTGPTVILPMLRTARLARRPATLLKWEGIVNDPLGVLLAFFAIQALGLFAPDSGGFFALLIPFIGATIAAVTIGWLAGILLGLALSKHLIAEHLRSPVILASVLAVHTSSELIRHESGVMAVTVCGIVLANSKIAEIHDVRHFKEQITTLLVSLLFIVLSANLELETLHALTGRPLLLVLAVIFLIRPILVGVATFRSGLPGNERALVSWIAPRGVVAAAMAGALVPELEHLGYADANLLVPLVFGVIIATVVMHGLSIRPVARKLGLAAGDNSGILVAGASRWALSLAQALAKTGVYVILADNRYRKVTRARQAGLDVHYGDILEEEAVYEFPMERISWVFAAGDDDSYNSLVCMHFMKELGREKTLQVTPSDTEGKAGNHGMRGRSPWGTAGSYEAITGRFWRGGEFKVTQVTEEFSLEQLREDNTESLFLFYEHEGSLHMLSPDAKAPTGAKIVYMS